VSVNKHKRHLYILPEDDDDRELANGFINNLWVNDRQARVLPVAGGWLSVLEKFKVEYIPHLKMYDQGNIVLLIDFDGEYESRSSKFAQEVPEELRDRVFVIGVMDEPRDLKRALNLTKNFEEIGSALADDCHDNTTKMWGHPHLKHNDRERIRLTTSVKSVLFAP
jgi:hypothetical protein